MERRGLGQNQAALATGVAQATISEVLSKGSVPKVETLFRLADGLETSRLEVLRLAGHLPAGEALDPLERELVGLFLQVPAGWRPVVARPGQICSGRVKSQQVFGRSSFQQALLPAQSLKGGVV